MSKNEYRAVDCDVKAMLFDGTEECAERIQEELGVPVSSDYRNGKRHFWVETHTLENPLLARLKKDWWVIVGPNAYYETTRYVRTLPDHMFRRCYARQEG